MHLDNASSAGKGFPLPITKEWGEGFPKERCRCRNDPLSPTLSPRVPRGEREHASLPMVAVPRGLELHGLRKQLPYDRADALAVRAAGSLGLNGFDHRPHFFFAGCAQFMNSGPD